MDKARAEKARAVALFRYAVISDAIEEGLTKKQKGVLVRHIAGRTHTGPDGKATTISRWTVDRWIRLWREGGFEALIPDERHIDPRTPQHLLDLAFALKKENPARTAAQVSQIIRTQYGDGPAERTLQTHFRRAGLLLPAEPASSPVPGRFETDAVNDLWIGDAMHGIKIGDGKTVLFAYIDDHSRFLVGYRWVRREDTIRAESALRPAIMSRGIPKGCYLDNGSPFVDAQLKQTLGKLGVRLIHTPPGQPRGRGKIERFFRTVRDQFLVEVTPDEFQDMEKLNRAFTAWVETVYHPRIHSETGQSPQERWQVSIQAGTKPRYLEAELVRQAFLWSEWRTVMKTATIQLGSNIYQVDEALVGRKIEVRYDPFDLTTLDVYLGGKPYGPAIPHVLRAQVHKRARPDETTITATKATGISYLHTITTRHEQKLGTGITFAPAETTANNERKAA